MRPTYSEEVHRALRGAQDAAGRFRHRFVHTEYMLLGLLQDRNSATEILKLLGLQREPLRRACERRCHKGEHVMEGERKLTPRVQHIMAMAIEEMQTYGDSEVDACHVLLGMLIEDEGIGGELLRSKGVTVEKVRAILEAPDAQHAARRQNHSAQKDRKSFWRSLLRV